MLRHGHRKGPSVDNTMGFTPLEGLMMGTRSGDVDPSLIPFLLREERTEIDDVMTLLNKKSGLLGISDKSLDTRVLMKDYGKDSKVTLAMDMFSYRVVKAVGAYLCDSVAQTQSCSAAESAKIPRWSGSASVPHCAGVDWKWTRKRIGP